MVLINIGSLSENELRNIASQEDLEDWETLSRDELIDALEDLYDEDENSSSMHLRICMTRTKTV